MEIGQAVKKIRKSQPKEYGQAKFAKKIGISQTYLSQIENGHKDPSTEVLKKIAKAFKTPLPVMFWMGIEESDVRPDRLDLFRRVRPTIDNLMDSCFNEDPLTIKKPSKK